MEQRVIYFNEELHKYTDELDNPYTSTTTVIGKYAKKFDTKKVARLCAMSGMRGNPKYKGKSAKQLEAEWNEITQEALDNGNEEHNFLEQVVKNSNGYNKIAGTTYINDRLYTVPEIIKNPDIGVVDIEYFEKQGLDKRHPKIYSLLSKFINKGYRLYTEIGVYHSNYLISGLIDLLLIKDDEFIIIDWKTNKSPIRYESGYFEKDVDGNITDNFIRKNDVLLPPLSHLSDSVGNKYTLQLSVYDYLVECFGYRFGGNILCHVRGREEKTVDFLPIKYLKKEVISMFSHFRESSRLGSQYSLI